jgi:iron complex outermembrane receptor protein
MSKVKGFVAATMISGFALVGGMAFSPAASAQQEAGAVIEEIIVTAQKRDQALADIPMSITVLSEADLERQQADNFQDFAAMVPGLTLSSGQRGSTRLTLRGINSSGSGATLGVYLGDVPFGSSTGLANSAILAADFDAFDISRIEVLRGPQGTIYGASALGGVLKYVPNLPSTEGVEVKLQVSGETVEDGDFGSAFTGVLNLPVGDNFAIRASGFYREDKGYVDSLGNNPIPSLDPSTGQLDFTIPVVAGSRVEKGVNWLDTSGGRVAAQFTPTDSFSLYVTVFTQKIESGSPDEVESDPDTLAPLDSSPTQSRYHPAFNDIEYNVASASIDWDLGAVSVESITSYGELEQNSQQDIAIAQPLFGAGLDTATLLTFTFGDRLTQPLSGILPGLVTLEKFAQELRVVSADSDKFEWLIGAYYTDEKSVFQQDVIAVEAETENPAAGLPILYTARIPSDYEEIALFANATWYITPRFELSFGGRLSDNSQDVTQRLEGLLVGGVLDFDNTKSSETPFTWSIAPRFELNDNSSLYARIATGFRPGGPNILLPGSPPGTPTSYDSDSLTNYEVGYNMNAADNKFALEIAAFFLDWEDIQLIEDVGGLSVIGNGGTAESKGVEFVAELFPTDGLTLSLNGAYTDAKITQDTQSGLSNGDAMPYVAEWTYGLNGEYEWAVLGDSTAYISGGVAYIGDRPAGFGDDDSSGNRHIISSTTTVNLNAGISVGFWTIELYGKNLTDERSILNVGGAGFYPNGAIGVNTYRPRTVGLKVGVSF